MTDNDLEMEDPLVWPFWKAAADRRLLIQQCISCKHHQFYPRPFCLSCDSTDLAWVDSAGNGEIYSATTVRVKVLPDLPPPYQVCLVRLDEGVMFLAGVVGPDCAIGTRVEVTWRDRVNAPPFPCFQRICQ